MRELSPKATEGAKKLSIYLGMSLDDRVWVRTAKSKSPLKTKVAKENAFSLLPPQAVPLPRLMKAVSSPYPTSKYISAIISIGSAFSS